MVKPFVLIGMEHTSEFVDKILAVARKNFPRGSRVVVEMPESGIVTALVIEAFARGGVLNEDLRTRALRNPPVTSSERGTEWLRELVEQNLAVPAKDRQLLIDNMKSSFNNKFICGLRDAGIEPIAGNSRYSQDRDKWVIDEPLRERFFVNRIKKEVKNGAVGAIYGAEHMGRVEAQLIRAGIPTRSVRVQSWQGRLASKLQYFAFPQNMIKWAWWKGREAKKQVKRRLRK
jgi:hypothetical protein